MATIKTLRIIANDAYTAFDAARVVYHYAQTECGTNYSDPLYASLGGLEASYRAARVAMETADAQLEHAELVNVGVRRG